jgi:hypothetical protein
VEEYESDKQRISDYADTHPEALAGWWIEHHGPPPMDPWRTPYPPSAFVIAFTSDIESHAEALRSLLFAPEKLQVIQMRYSYRHLMEVRDSIPPALGPANEGLATWGPDTKGNFVRVTALPEYFEEIRHILMATNPDDVRVEVGQRPVPA